MYFVKNCLIHWSVSIFVTINLISDLNKALVIFEKTVLVPSYLFFYELRSIILNQNFLFKMWLWLDNFEGTFSYFFSLVDQKRLHA